MLSRESPGRVRGEARECAKKCSDELETGQQGE